MVTMSAKPYLVIPAALRRRCGLRPGDRVLLAVFPAVDMLAAYSFAVVDQALRAHATLPDDRQTRANAQRYGRAHPAARCGAPGPCARQHCVTRQQKLQSRLCRVRHSGQQVVGQHARPS